MSAFDMKTKLIIAAGAIGYLAIMLWSAKEAFRLARCGDLKGRGWITIALLSTVGFSTLALLLMLK